MPSVPLEQLDMDDKLILYAVNKSKNGVPTKTHYQKMMYWIYKMLKDDPVANHGYRPHHFGPYSDIEEDKRNMLIDTGFLDKNTCERISINQDVKETVSHLGFNDDYLDEGVESIVQFVCSLTKDELILFIYSDDVQKGEGMTSNSIIIDEVFRNRVDIAKNMVIKGKVSIAKGAELADIDIGSFMNLIQKATV